jgi:hypothetical protein
MEHPAALVQIDHLVSMCDSLLPGTEVIRRVREVNGDDVIRLTCTKRCLTNVNVTRR